MPVFANLLRERASIRVNCGSMQLIVWEVGKGRSGKGLSDSDVPRDLATAAVMS